MNPSTHTLTHTLRHEVGLGQPGINNLNFLCLNNPILLVAHQPNGLNLTSQWPIHPSNVYSVACTALT